MSEILLMSDLLDIRARKLKELEFYNHQLKELQLKMAFIQQEINLIDLYSPGEKLIYDVMNVTFYVDEELKAWLEVHDWLRAMTFPTEFEEYQNLNNLNNFTRYANSDRPQFSEGSLTLLSSANTPYYKFKFIDLFPVSLSSFVVATSDSPDTIITADATFRFAYYNVEKLF